MGKVEKEVARRHNRNYIGAYERLGLLERTRAVYIN